MSDNTGIVSDNFNYRTLFFRFFKVIFAFIKFGFLLVSIFVLLKCAIFATNKVPLHCKKKRCAKLLTTVIAHLTRQIFITSKYLIMLTTKVKHLSESAKLRQKNVFLLFGFFLSAGCCWLLVSYFLAAALFSFLGAVLCLWLLVSPTVQYLPATRHSVISLDVTGASKSIRFVRTNTGTFMPAVFTPKTDKSTVQKSLNTKLQKIDGTVKLSSDVVLLDTFTFNGNFHKVVLSDFETDTAGAMCMYLAVLAHSKDSSIFDTNELRKFFTYIQNRIFVPVLVVRFVLVLVSALHYAFLLSKRSLPPYPTQEVADSAAGAGLGTVQTKKSTNVKEVSYE